MPITTGSIKRKVRVLIVDDSLLFRETLSRGLSGDAGIEVVATASDPFEARDKIIEFEPDVMTLDVEMPKMNGIEFLRRLMPQYPIPTIVVSAVNKNVFDALNAGAVDFVVKPSGGDNKALEWFMQDLTIKIKIASVARVGQLKNNHIAKSISGNSESNTMNKVIAIGASTGGTEAIYSIIKSFPANMPGVLVVQHMPANFTRMYAERLNNSCAMNVKEAENGDKVIPGRVLIAPGDYHMRVIKSPGGYAVECFKGDRVNGHCPSVDVMFHSVSEHIKNNAIGVILTGMGYDGAKGLLAMKRKGAATLGQDEQSSVVYGMPKVAYDIGAVDRQVSLDLMAQAIYTALNKKI